MLSVGHRTVGISVPEPEFPSASYSDFRRLRLTAVLSAKTSRIISREVLMFRARTTGTPLHVVATAPGVECPLAETLLANPGFFSTRSGIDPVGLQVRREHPSSTSLGCCLGLDHALHLEAIDYGIVIHRPDKTKHSCLSTRSRIVRRRPVE